MDSTYLNAICMGFMSLANCDAAILEITTKTDLFKSRNVNEIEFEDCNVQSDSKIIS